MDYHSLLTSNEHLYWNSQAVNVSLVHPPFELQFSLQSYVFSNPCETFFWSPCLISSNGIPMKMYYAAVSRGGTVYKSCFIMYVAAVVTVTLFLEYSSANLLTPATIRPSILLDKLLLMLLLRYVMTMTHAVFQQPERYQSLWIDSSTRAIFSQPFW